MTGIELRHR